MRQPVDSFLQQMARSNVRFVLYDDALVAAMELNGETQTYVFHLTDRSDQPHPYAV